jgi:AcrR family transcriptional regulator
VPDTDGTARRRGRRPAGADTRAALLTAAREVFAEQGFSGATVRTIAARAGVDAAMVNHWFGGKQGLFAATINLPAAEELPEIVARILDDSTPDQVAERVIGAFVTVWDASEGQFAALVRSVSSQEAAASMMRDFLTTQVLGQITARLGVDRPKLRATLAASQMIGLGMVRYVLLLEPLASAPVAAVVAAVAPTLDRYLTGEIAG